MLHFLKKRFFTLFTDLRFSLDFGEKKLGRCFSLGCMWYLFLIRDSLIMTINFVISLFRFGVMGLVFDYGCEHKITSFSRLGAFMSIGQITGVTLKIK